MADAGSPYKIKHRELVPLFGSDTLASTVLQVVQIYPDLNAPPAEDDLIEMWGDRTKANADFRKAYTRPKKQFVVDGIEFRRLYEIEGSVHYAVCVNKVAAMQHRTWPLYTDKSLVELADDLLGSTDNDKERIYIFGAKGILFSPVGGRLATPIATFDNQMCVFDDCTFAGFTGQTVVFLSCVFINCKFTNFSTKMAAYDTRRRNTRAAAISNVQFTNCDMAGTSFAGVQFNNVIFEVCDLTEADFDATTCTPSIVQRATATEPAKVVLRPIVRSNAEDDFSEEEVQAEIEKVLEERPVEQQAEDESSEELSFSIDRRLEYFFKVEEITPRLIMQYCYFSKTTSEKHSLAEGFFVNEFPVYNIRTHYLDVFLPVDYIQGIAEPFSPERAEAYEEAARELREQQGNRMGPLLPAVFVLFQEILMEGGATGQPVQLRVNALHELVYLLAATPYKTMIRENRPARKHRPARQQGYAYK